MSKSRSVTRLLATLALASSAASLLAAGSAAAESAAEPSAVALPMAAGNVAAGPGSGVKAHKQPKAVIDDAARARLHLQPEAHDKPSVGQPSSAQPSTAPTAQPSTVPTAQPSTVPTAQPSSTPAAQPSEASAPTQAPAKTGAAAAPDTGGANGTAAAIAASRAEAEKRDRAEDPGIDDDRDVVKAVLAKHPDSNVVICVAGCGPEPTIVQVLPRAPETRTDSEVVPSSAGDVAKDAASDVKPNQGEIICVAGCKDGKRGTVVFKKAKISWIDPDQSDDVRSNLRAIAARFEPELRQMAEAERSETLTTWSGMGRRMAEASAAPQPKRATLADASADAAPAGADDRSP